jgi:hypothetical protein
MTTASPLPTTTSPGMDHQTPLFPPPLGAKNAGITIHDWLAALAMQGLLMHGMKVSADRALTEDEKDNQLAERAYKIANAMVRTRPKHG